MLCRRHSSRPVDGNVLSDDKPHKIFANSKRTSISRACSSDDLGKIDPPEHNVGIHRELRPNLLKHSARLCRVDMKGLDDRSPRVLLEDRIARLEKMAQRMGVWG